MRIRPVSLLAIVAALGCGEKPPPEKPFILTDVASIGFDVQFGRGTYIGTAPVNSLTVTNEGLADLVIEDVSKTGDSAFTFVLDGQCTIQGGQRVCGPVADVLPKTVKGKQNTFIQVTFTPTEVRRYTGQLVIKSNADNFKELNVGLFGCGVRAGVDGGTDVQPDGGCLPQ